MSQGIVFFAHNNTEIDYGSVAITNATMIKHHMGVDAITLITDEGTMRHMNDTWDKNIIDNIKKDLNQKDNVLRYLFIKVKSHQELPTKLANEKK